MLSKEVNMLSKEVNMLSKEVNFRKKLGNVPFVGAYFNSEMFPVGALVK